MRLPITLLRRLFNRENTWALLLSLIILALAVMTAGRAPLWIYQGF